MAFRSLVVTNWRCHINFPRQNICSSNLLTLELAVHGYPHQIWILFCKIKKIWGTFFDDYTYSSRNTNRNFLRNHTTKHRQPLLVLLLCPLTSLFFFFAPSSADLISRQRPWPSSTPWHYDVSLVLPRLAVEGRGRWSARTALFYCDVRRLRTTHHQCPWRHDRGRRRLRTCVHAPPYTVPTADWVESCFSPYIHLVSFRVTEDT